MFGTFVGANVYLTPPDAQGFAPHWVSVINHSCRLLWWIGCNVSYCKSSSSHFVCVSTIYLMHN